MTELGAVVWGSAYENMLLRVEVQYLLLPSLVQNKTLLLIPRGDLCTRS